MKQANQFIVQPAWKTAMVEMGANVLEVLKLANLPEDLFNLKYAVITAKEYFRLWRALATILDNNTFPKLIGQSISFDAFEPSIFASLCSANLNVALMRLSQFKRLMGPLHFNINALADYTEVQLVCVGVNTTLPSVLAMSELVFITTLVRMATKRNITPISVQSVEFPSNKPVLDAFFGIVIEVGEKYEIRFASEDANAPFIVEYPKMWAQFAPCLQSRLPQLKGACGTRERVKAALLEMLPGGQSTIEEVAKRLALSKRTLQRRLNEERTNYQQVLKTTREDLAKHYLRNSSLSFSEVSFLLGFLDTNSFYRAFHQWTQSTPERYRYESRHRAPEQSCPPIRDGTNPT